MTHNYNITRHMLYSLSCHARITNSCLSFPPKREHRHNTRQSRAYAMPRTHTNRVKNTFIPSMCT